MSGESLISFIRGWNEKRLVTVWTDLVDASEKYVAESIRICRFTALLLLQLAPREELPYQRCKFASFAVPCTLCTTWWPRDSDWRDSQWRNKSTTGIIFSAQMAILSKMACHIE